MEEQLKTLANVGSLSHFVGMLTDSRSFLSFPRHEYFRRILCNLLGVWMADGFVPDDFELVGSLAKRICYSNAKRISGLGNQLVNLPKIYFLIARSKVTFSPLGWDLVCAACPSNP